MRVLIVEDEVKMAALLRRGLSEEGHLAEVAGDGETAVAMARASAYDAIVLDVMLPRLDGFSACRQMREAGVWTGVLMLTARDSVHDRVAGLDCGADDYLVKPFSFSELLARLRALARRAESPRPTQLIVGDLRLDPATRRVWRGEVEVRLSTKEFTLLENRSNVVDVYIRYLRQKVDRPFNCATIETVRGAGYRLNVPAQ
jgi:two-component system OmpR family response regulator